MQSFYNTFFNLHKGEDDRIKTIENVKNNISFTGANLWILASAILVASVGLNVNSSAVIIGAMLISPLMGPILAAGFALGIYDFQLLKRSLRNLLIATVTSLIVSTIYFYISPFKDAQPEILARTSPNIYDILIAFFGGLVGVIAVTRVEKGNPIPGVAIATALMPPLCTAGYGLATGNFKFFFGALFLYCINCVFICLATYSIVKLLKYPAIQQIDKKHQIQVRYGISIIVILLVVPAIYFSYRLFNEQQYRDNLNKFITHEFLNKGNTIVYKKTNYNSSPKTIELAFLSKHFSEEDIKLLNKKLEQSNVPNTKLLIKQDSADKIELLKNDILNEMKEKDILIEEKNRIISGLKVDNEFTKYDNKQIFKEAKIIFPELKSLGININQFYYSNDSTGTGTVVLYEVEKAMAKNDELKFENWLKQRLSIKSIDLIKK